MTAPHREQLARIVNEFVDGWNERIEYFVRTVVHTRACLAETREITPGQLKHHTCACPKRLEARAKTVKHPALLVQLHSQAAKENPVTGMEHSGGKSTKPESSPPGSLDALELLVDLRHQVVAMRAALGVVTTHAALGTAAHMRALVNDVAQSPEHAQAAADALRRLARRARVLLGHDAPMRVLADVTCGECGGALVVAADASSDVRCIGTDTEASCGTVYRRYQWAELLDNEGAA